MGKIIFRFILLVIGFAAIAYGGYIVYQKQYYPIVHGSFAPENSIRIYVPDAKKIESRTNGLRVLGSYAGDNYLNLIELFAPAFEGSNSLSFQMSSTNSQQVISFKGLPDRFFNSNLQGMFSEEDGTVEIKGILYFYWRKHDFLVLSNAKIKPRVIRKRAQLNRGNADFFFEGDDHVVEAIKLTDNVKFSAFIMDDTILRGKPVNPLPVLSICPISADLIKFYGSSRFNADQTVLVSKTDKLFWVQDELLFIEKDSFEVLIGIQDDEVQLKNTLLETMSERDPEQALKSIYFNSIEIIPFDVDWNWQRITDDISSDMKYFAAYNDFVFLTNSLQSMYWLLKSIQLGKTYDVYELSKKIPSRVNQLVLANSEQGLAISSKTWISPVRTINLAAMSNRTIGSNSRELVAEFAHIEPCKYLIYSDDIAGEKVVTVTGNHLKAYNIEGQELWTYKTTSDVNILPKTLTVNGMCNFLIASESRLISLNSSGKENFNIEFKNQIKGLQVFVSSNDTLYMAQTTNSVHLIKANGSEVSTGIQWLGDLKLAKMLKVNDRPALSIVTQKDSIFVYDLATNERFSTKNSFKTAALNTVVSGENLASEKLKLLTYNSGYLKIKYFSSDIWDSIKLNTKVKPDRAYWLEFRNKPVLVFETFDRVLVFNELGLSEIEIAKPEPNYQFVPDQFIENEIFAFVDPKNKQYYFTDVSGNLLVKNPIDNEGLTFAYDKVLVSKSQNRIHIYNIE